MGKRLRDVPGLSSIDDGIRTGKPELVLRLKESGLHVGITADEMARQVRHRFQGVEILRFVRGSSEVKVRVTPTNEELETSNEELQATNQELLASNEELQSTNEELQSTNEELHTVNTEHQNKIIELTELHNDVDNALKMLKKAIKRNPQEKREMRLDKDFESLHNDIRFWEIVAP